MKKAIAITVDEFKDLLNNKQIRPASLDDVWGTQHDRPIYLHPNTKQPYVKTQ